MTDDLIGRAEAQTAIQFAARRYTVAHEAHGEGQVVWSDNLINVTDAMNVLRDLPSAQPKQRWIPVTEIPPRGRDLMLKIHDACNSFFYYHMGFHDGEKYFTYNFFWQRDKDLEIVGWQLCPWEEGEQE